jgi:membrane-bound lytic murein transglycosylase D
MSGWLRFVSVAGLIAWVGLTEFRCEGDARPPGLEQLQGDIVRLRQAIEEFGTRLDALQRFYDMDRYRFPKKIQLFDSSIPLERRDVWERMDREFLLSVHDVPQVLLWTKRANRYFPMIREKLQRRGLPDDLKYVAIVESALRPEARSWAGAEGLWQFIPATGARYQLRKTAWVDERRDPIKSTDAALNYLEDLHVMFGDWFLAVAAYNTGEERVERALERQKVTTYFDLALPDETERYVFRIAAAKAILADPQAHGFELLPDELYEPVKMEPVEVAVKSENLDLVSLADACGVTFRALIDLNPQFRRSHIPRGEYIVYVPPGKATEAVAFVKSWNEHEAHKSASPDGKDKIIHRVQAGETLGEIAQKYKVYVKSIKEWNNLKDTNFIHVGQRLVIYK